MSRPDIRDTGAALLIRSEGERLALKRRRTRRDRRRGDKKGGLERSRWKGEAARGRGKAQREGQKKSRADARDTGATLLIRGDGALGVETPAHKEG